jgi:hypothetical protein
MYNEQGPSKIILYESLTFLLNINHPVRKSNLRQLSCEINC